MALYKTDENGTLTKIAGNIHTVEQSSGSTLPSDVVRDQYYTHTDNNYTATDKNKLAGIESGANKLLLSDILSDILLAVYPVGSIIMSDSSENPGLRFGGTWVKYAEGRTIIGDGTSDRSFSKGDTGGESTHTLTKSEMPSHTHTYTKPPSSTDSHTLTVSEIPSHKHTIWRSGDGGGQWTGMAGSPSNSYSGWTDAVIGSTGGGNGHTHDITNTTENSGSEGSGGSHNNLQPYIVTYIWKRTA